MTSETKMNSSLFSFIFRVDENVYDSQEYFPSSLPAFSSESQTNQTFTNAYERSGQSYEIQNEAGRELERDISINIHHPGNTPQYADLSLLRPECRFEFLHVCVPMYRAALQGNWKAAEDVLKMRPDAFRIAITQRYDTALHVAVVAKRTSFVRKLVQQMTKSELELQDIVDNTATYTAAVVGDVEIAKLMVKKNTNLPMIRGHNGLTPLDVAANMGHKHMISYLYEVTNFEELTRTRKVGILNATIYTDMYDIALQILNKDPTLALGRDSFEDTALHALARKPLAFASEGWLGIISKFIKYWICNKTTKSFAHQLVEDLWGQVIGLQEQEIFDLINRPSRLLHEAAKVGNVEFLILLIRSYPMILWTIDENKHSLFHVAIKYRHESLFGLIYEIGGLKDLLAWCFDENKNSVLHLAAQLPPPSRLKIVSGAALQLQRELLWFKEVENIVPSNDLKLKNSDGYTPRELFTLKHQDLVKDGEKWMKDTSTSCMLVAALIATVVFAATFTVPGGNNNETGQPMFLEEKWFRIFVISDAFALFFSINSIILFLSILTSRFAEEDFLVSLPRKLMFGLTALFASIACMLLAFAATLFLVYINRGSWAPILVAVFACAIVIFFIALHHKLWIDTIRSTFWSRYLFQPCRRWLLWVKVEKSLKS